MKKKLKKEQTSYDLLKEDAADKRRSIQDEERESEENQSSFDYQNTEEEQPREDSKKETLITKEGLKKLQEELDHLRNVKRKEVAARIKEAISYGDLSENAEYEEAKNEQAFVEGRILELEEKVKSAKIISEKHKVGKTVQMGTTVYLENLTKNKGEIEQYTIVGSTEADPFDGKISNESPVGSALLDKARGDVIKVIVPAGTVEYCIKKLD